MLLHLGWETLFLLEALAVPGSSGEEGKNKAWVAEGNTGRADRSLAREARVSSLGWFLLACWGLPGSLKTREEAHQKDKVHRTGEEEGCILVW